MNKMRRKELDKIIERIQEVMGDLESIMAEEEDYRDNMPENLQGSERYEQAENACDAMQEALDQLEEAVSNIEYAQE